MSEKWDRRYLALARHVSTWSKDPSTQTGAVIVRADKTVGSVGFNGFPAGMPDAEAWLNDRAEKYSRTVHCEMNALIHMHDHAGLHGAILYTWPFASCDRCVVHMLSAGIRRFVFPPLPFRLIERWGEAVTRTKEYILAANCEFVELELTTEEGD